MNFPVWFLMMTAIDLYHDFAIFPHYYKISYVAKSSSHSITGMIANRVLGSIRYVSPFHSFLLRSSHMENPDFEFSL